jgi:tetratricopeptide (TPR) repeat protein
MAAESLKTQRPLRLRRALPLLVIVAVVGVAAGDALVTGRAARVRWVTRLPTPVLNGYASAFSGDPVAHYALALRHREAGDSRSAHSLERALRLDPTFLPARAHYAGTLLDQGEGARAYEIAQQCLSEDAGCVPALVVLGRLHARREEWPKARQCAETAVTHSRDDAGAWLLLARAREALGEQAEAAQAADRSVELAPNSPQGWVVRARCALALGDGGAGRTFAERAVALGPRDAPAHLCRGEALLAAGDAEALRAAEGAFRRALLLAPENGQALVGLGRALSGQGRWKEAVTPLRAAIRQAPLRNDARRLLAASLHALGDFKESAHWDRERARWDGLLAEKARIEGGRAGTSYSQNLHFRLAKLYGRMGLWQRGLREADAGLRAISQPYAADFVEGFRRAYALRGDPIACETALRALKDL